MEPCDTDGVATLRSMQRVLMIADTKSIGQKIISTHPRPDQTPKNIS